MCEFKVFLDGELVMEDVIGVTVEGGKVVLRDVIGETKTFDGAAVVEVSVPATRLTLARA
ncbi:MAG: CooT family nickel-binding protein [Candidatus Bathyarchaeota archaeon]|nr:MAG: CooT family nickel-binding protein [Candidatus Bathyarchaeota archaeon]